MQPLPQPRCFASPASPVAPTAPKPNPSIGRQAPRPRGRMPAVIYRRRRCAALGTMVTALVASLALVAAPGSSRGASTPATSTSEAHPGSGSSTGASGAGDAAVSNTSANHTGANHAAADHAGVDRPQGFSPGEVYIVKHHDTLWNIAKRLAPGRDPRPLVYELTEQLGNDRLQAGQRLDLTRWQ